MVKPLQVAPLMADN